MKKRKSNQILLSKEEEKERNRLLELQKISNRWFSQEEFDRLKELSAKAFHAAGDPRESSNNTL